MEILKRDELILMYSLTKAEFFLIRLSYYVLDVREIEVNL